uniref:Uncharacterized protein n=1 Tax=Panagrellus redivivus TaxID=6233 RepID=A0A7E4W8W3_PANRE
MSAESETFSWENPDVTELFDAYIHGFSLSNTKMDKSHIEQPEARSLTTLAQALCEKYNNAKGINRHTVRHQIDKRKKVLNIPKKPKIRKRRASTEEPAPASPRKRGRPPKNPPTAQPQRSPAKSNGIPTPAPARHERSPSPDIPIPGQAGPAGSLLEVLMTDNVRVEFVETLRRARALMDAQIELAVSQKAYFDRKNQAEGIFDLNNENGTE